MSRCNRAQVRSVLDDLRGVAWFVVLDVSKSADFVDGVESLEGESLAAVDESCTSEKVE